MEAAHMTFAQETLRLRAENKTLRQENARLKISNTSRTRESFLTSSF